MQILSDEHVLLLAAADDEMVMDPPKHFLKRGMC